MAARDATIILTTSIRYLTLFELSHDRQRQEIIQAPTSAEVIRQTNIEWTKHMKTNIVITVISSVFLAGCIPDGVAERHVIVEEVVSFPAKPSYFESIEVDTSLLPPGSEVQRVDSKDRYGDPITTIKVFSPTALKLTISPTTQP